MKPNRRKFKTPEGKIIETSFNAYWYAIDKTGKQYLYRKKPTVGYFGFLWWPIDSPYFKMCGYQAGEFNWKKCRWYLNDNGEWIRK